MEVLFNKTNDLHANIVIKIAEEDYKKEYEQQLERYKKQVNLPGFRPGKVPTAIIKKRYGTGVLAEHINQTVNKELQKYISENALNFLGNPIPANLGDDKADFENPSDFQFTFELGLSPEVDIKLTKREKYAYYQIKADAEMIDRQVSDMTRRYGKLSEPEAAEATDMIIGDVIELENGEIKEGGIMQNATIALEFVEDKATVKKFVGAGAGDTVDFDIDKVSKGNEDKAKMLGISVDDAANAIGDFRINVKEIKRLQPAELNQELFDKLYEKDAVKTEEEFRAKLAEDLEKGFVNDADKLFRKNLMEKLISKNAFELPDEFLKRWIKSANEKPLGDEELEKEYPQYAQHLREQLIENSLVKTNDIKIEPADLEKFIGDSIKQQYAMYGMNIPEAELANHVSTLMQKGEERNRYAEALIQQKVVEFAKENVKLDEKEVSYTEFIELMYPKSAK
jgi:trigger factor